MSPELEAATASAEIIPRMLVTIYGNGTDIFRFVANDNQDLTFEGNVYRSAEIKRGEIKTTVEGDKEQVPLTLSNRWKEWAAYIANNGKALKYKKCVIQEVYLDHLEEGAVWLFEGILNSLKTTMAEFSCVVERDTVDFSQDAPNMDYGPTCQFVYKGADNRCRATSSLPSCDGTMAACIQRGNVTRYGGHPSVPKQMVIRT
jgi:phage-related protein